MTLAIILCGVALGLALGGVVCLAAHRSLKSDHDADEARRQREAVTRTKYFGKDDTR